MKLIQVWCEGFAATGNSGKAQCIGSYQGESLTEVLKAQQAKGNLNIHFDKQGVPSIWGCQLFDNEADARKSFG